MDANHLSNSHVNETLDVSGSTLHPFREETDWIEQLSINVILYAIMISIVAFFPFDVLRRRHDTDDSANHTEVSVTVISSVVPIVGDHRRDNSDDIGIAAMNDVIWINKLSKIGICVLGLNTAYLSWGVLQERILTQKYGDEVFASSQFLVLVNRVGGCVMSGIVLLYTRPRGNDVPLVAYCVISASNITSSWCLYEALKFVSFPTQVVSKSFKIIIVMLMGRVVSRKFYPMYEYIVACCITIGVLLFAISKGGVLASTSIGIGDTRPEGPAAQDLYMYHTQSVETTEETHLVPKGTSLANGGGHEDVSSAMLLLLLYLVLDSFTSQWQGKVFDDFRVSSYQMMFAVNAFSVAFCFTTMVQTGELTEAVTFIALNPAIHSHLLLASLCSSVGQLFIFYTIKTFGPLVFTIIMTTRQVLSIALSCVVFGHPINGMGYIGMMLVFSSLGYRMFRQAQASSHLWWRTATNVTAPTVVGGRGGRSSSTSPHRFFLSEWQSGFD